MSQALEGKRVLLVDDDNDILISMQAAFEPTGAIIDTAHDGNRAVELAEKNQPDLVVLDMMLPKRSGFLVLEKIKAKKPRNTKPFVVMITARAASRSRSAARAHRRRNGTRWCGFPLTRLRRRKLRLFPVSVGFARFQSFPRHPAVPVCRCNGRGSGTRTGERYILLKFE